VQSRVEGEVGSVSSKVILFFPGFLNHGQVLSYTHSRLRLC
jgi:hypothetical protein